MAVAAVVATQGGGSRGTREVEVQVGAKKRAHQVQWYEFRSIPSEEQNSPLTVCRCSPSGSVEAVPARVRTLAGGRRLACLRLALTVHLSARPLEGRTTYRVPSTQCTASPTGLVPSRPIPMAGRG